jgi:hypothetical protein
MNLSKRMSRPDFFEPKPVSNNIHRKLERRTPILKRRQEFAEPIGSALGKRTMEEAFGQGTNDKERYGQEISPNFFRTNVGHNVRPSSEYYTYNKHNTTNFTHLYEDRIKYWQQKYSLKR